MPSEHSSRQYELDLEAIRSKVLLMGGIVEKQFQDAIACFRTLNLQEADRIIAADLEVNKLEVDLAELSQEITEYIDILSSREKL
jgi:phosphate transport system protein